MSGPTKKPAPAPKAHHRVHVPETTKSAGQPGYEEARFKALTDLKARSTGKGGNPADWTPELEKDLDNARIADAAVKKAAAPAPKPAEG